MEQGVSGVRFRVNDEAQALLLELLHAERDRINTEHRRQSRATTASNAIAFRLGAIKSNARLGLVERLIERLERL